MKVFGKNQKLFNFKQRTSDHFFILPFRRYLVLALLAIVIILFSWFWRVKKAGSLRQSYKFH